MTARELLERLNLLDENERIEAKSASEVGRSLLESVCAYANEPGLGGGWLLLGVERSDADSSPSYVVRGVEQPDQLSSDLASQAATVFNIPLRIEIRTEDIGDKVVMAVFVYEVPAHDKPVYFKSTGLPRGAFRRIGSTDQHCTDDDLQVLFQGRQQEGFDSGLVPGATLDDFAAEAIADYRRSRIEANPDAEELRWSEFDLLQALGCIARDENDAWQPTVAGLLLFGKPVALRRSFPMTRVDYIRVPGREWVPDPETRFDSVELRDPLFRLIRRVQAAIVDDLPKSFGLVEGDLQRKDSPVVPLRVIREAVVNALMHRSYRIHAPVQIIRYSNRLEIRNPGFSLKSPEHLGEPGSMPRNPKVAAALYDARFAETKGSGIRVIKEMCERAGLAPPLFESNRNNDAFVIRLFFHHFLGPEDLDWLARFKDLHLSDAEARTLIFAREVGAMDNATWRDINKVDALAATHGLKRLRDAGLLQQNGRGSATWYQPTALMMGEDVGLPSNLEALPGNLGALSSNPDGLSSNLDPVAEAARRTLLNELPGELAARVGALGKRQSPEVVRDVVLLLCSHRDYKAEELAQLLIRNTETVRQSYLRPLLRAGRITMTRPDKPNDPGQSYRAIEGESE